MKKITLCILLILALIIPNIVLATEISDTATLAKPVAKIGEETYTSLADAVKAAPVDGTKTEIVLLTNVENGPGLITEKGQNVVIDFNGFSYDVSEETVGSNNTKTNCCQFLKGSTVTLKNGTLTTRKAKRIIQNYSNLTLQDMFIDGTKSVNEISYVISFNNGIVNIIGDTAIKASEGNCVFDNYFWPDGGYTDGAQITIDTIGMIAGDIEFASSSSGLSKTLPSTLTVKNMYHEGEFKFIDSRFEDKVTIEGGTYTTDLSKYLADGLICPEIYELYNVVSDKLYNINVEDVEGGKIIVDKTKVQYGEIVNFEIEIDDGYEFKSIEISDGHDGRDEIDTTSFMMLFEKDITITPAFSKIASPQIEAPKEVTIDEKIENMLLSSLDEVLKENKELATLVNNNKVEVQVVLEDIKIEDKEKEVIEKAIEEKVKDIKVVKYLDISINVKVRLDEIPEGKIVGNLEELKEKLTFSIEIPTDLPKVEEGYSRTYYIIRNHNGVVEILDTKVSEDGAAIEFSSDKFSTYAIAYSDVKVEDKIENKVEEKDETPKTGSLNITMYILIVFVIILFVKVLINNKNEKCSK